MPYYQNQNRYQDVQVAAGGGGGGEMQQQNTSPMGGWRNIPPPQMPQMYTGLPPPSNQPHHQPDFQHSDMNRNSHSTDQAHQTGQPTSQYAAVTDMNQKDRGPPPPVHPDYRNATGNRQEHPRGSSAMGNRHERTGSGNAAVPMDAVASDHPQKKISLKPKDIEVLEREITGRAKSMSDVQEICRCQARFQHFVKFKGFAQAKKMMTKKPKQYSQGRPFSCQTCDEYYPNKYDLDNHLKGNSHKDICQIYGELEDMGESIWKKKENKKVEENSQSTNRNNSQNTNQNNSQNQAPPAVSYQRQARTQNIPPSVQPYADESTNKLREDILSLEPLTMEKEDFILASYEKVMSEYWPVPSTDYYCRCCNYTQFKTERELNIHMKSARHLDYERNYGLAFCLSCQFHTGDEDGMHMHLQSARHIEIQNMMDATRLEALRIWEETQVKNQPAPPDTAAEVPSPDVQDHPIPDGATGASDMEVVADEKPKAPMATDRPKDEKEEGRHSRGGNIRTDRRKSDRSSGRDRGNDRGRDHSARDRSRDRKRDTDAKNDDKKKTGEKKDGDDGKKTTERRGDRKRSRSKDGEKKDQAKKKPEGDKGKKPEDVAAAVDDKVEVVDVAVAAEPNVPLDNEPMVVEKTEKEIIEADNFVMPLPGYMCTVCAETLPNDALAAAHIGGTSHADKVVAHKKKLGIPVVDEKAATPEQPPVPTNGTRSPASAKRHTDTPTRSGSKTSSRQAEAAPVVKQSETFTPPWHGANEQAGKDPYRKSGTTPQPPAIPPPDEQPLVETTPQLMRDRDAEIQRQQQQHVQQNYNLNSRGKPSPVARPPPEAVAKAPIISYQHSSTAAALRQSYGGQPSANPTQPYASRPTAQPQQPSSQDSVNKQNDSWNSTSNRQHGNKPYNRGLRGSRY